MNEYVLTNKLLYTCAALKNHPLTMSIHLCDFKECVEPLGMQNGDIKDNQITATSSRSADLPHYGRLHNKKYWCAAKKSKDEYIQVDLGKVRTIGRV